MSKYYSVLENIYSVFELTAWKNLNIKTFPSNYVGIYNDQDFIRVTVLPNSDCVNRASISGIIIIDIFVKAGLGPKAIALIADYLNDFLENKTFKINSGNTQLYNSTLSLSGIDSDNSALYRAIYTIPFKHFNEV